MQKITRLGRNNHRMGIAQTIWIEVYKQMHGHKTKRADLADKEKKIYQTVVDCCSFSGYKRV